MLRLGYSITGLVPSDEMAVGLPETASEFQQAPPERPWLDDDLPWGEDDLATGPARGGPASWEQGSREWTRARLAMLLTGDRERLHRDIHESLEGEEITGTVAS